MKMRQTGLLMLLICTALISDRSVLAEFSQQGPKLVGIGTIGNAGQGRSVAVSADGNTAIVGGTFDDNGAGAAWVWTRSGDIWTQQGAKLVGFGAVGNANQGTSVSLSADGNTAIVGGSSDNGQAGAAWVWTRSAGAWTQQGNKLVGSGAAGNAQQGCSVALAADGNTAIVGGYLDNHSVNSSTGAAWVWTRTAGVWHQQGDKLVGSGADGNYPVQGFSVSLSADGNTAIVGGYNDNDGLGAAWVWTRSAGVWNQQRNKLVGSGNVGRSWQGWSVALAADGNTAIIGAIEDNNATGAVWVWTRSGGIWTQQSPRLTASGNVGAALLGNSVSLSADGNTAFVGGPGGDGATWIWTRSAGIWAQQGGNLVGSDAVGAAEQGTSVSLSADGTTAIVGGPLDKGLAGAAWIFSTTPCPLSGDRECVVPVSPGVAAHSGGRPGN